jgi:tagaturonate reductase
MVGLGILRGFETVLDCMNDPEMSRFIEEVAILEIAPSTPVDSSISVPFAYEVLDRFRNPHIRHILSNITLQYSMKMAMRNLPTLARYETIFGKSPVLMAKGFAAYIRFMNPTRFENGKWFGEMNGMTYEIQDDKAKVFQELRQKPGFPGSVFKSKTLWNGFVFSEEFINSVSREYSSL